LFKFYKQLNAMDCGPTCIRMVARHYGKHYTTTSLRNISGFSKEGVSLLGISIAAEKIGFRTRGVQLSFDQLVREVSRPCILHWDQNHFVVLIPDLKINWGSNRKLGVADPARGIIYYSKEEFLTHWLSTYEEEEEMGTALLMEPTPSFYLEEGEKETKLSWHSILVTLGQSRWQIGQVFLALLITSIFQLIFPFLTQSIVDTGINTQNLQYVTIVLLAQLMLIFSRTVVEFIRSRLLLQISAVINLSILSDFWIKLTRLPLSYFDTHHTGDVL
jgi:ATP-binding cassette, subfamily B, bacterial